MEPSRLRAGVSKEQTWDPCIWKENYPFLFVIPDEAERGAKEKTASPRHRVQDLGAK
jgi:hypothetical protein